MPLLSVLLPTHDRLEYLRYAVESVRRQDDEDWEIVVSDNDSREDVEGFVAGLGDERIRYVRTQGFVPVTENWNNALRHSRGEYVVMLGDDDALLPGYGSSLRELIGRFERPEVIYTGALLFAYPGVLPDGPEGYVRSGSSAPFFAGAGTGAAEPHRLDPAQAHALVADAMALRATYGFNMQYVAVARAAIDELAGDGDFYRSPFPDFYAMNLLFARARTIVIDPRPRVVIGITKRSYGYLHFNQREAEALALLNNDATDPDIRRDLEDELVPGTNLNTGWLLAMEALHRRLGSPAELRPDYRRYRRLQAVYCYQHHYVGGSVSHAELAAVRGKLDLSERLIVGAGARVAGPLVGALPARVRQVAGRLFDVALRQQPRGSRPPHSAGRYRTILELIEQPPASPVPEAAAGGAPCRICGAATTAAFTTTDRNRRLSPQHFRYVRCTSCRTLALADVPEDLGAFYPPSYYRVPASRAELLAAAGEAERAKLALLHEFVPSGRLVEVGPAIGGFLAVAQQAGYDVEAIEMDEACCRFLTGELGVPTVRSDDPAQALAAGRPSDVIALWQVIEHLPDPVAVIAAAARALAPGGVLALAAPNPDAFQLRVFGSRWTHIDAPRHLFLLPLDTLTRVGAEHGLEPVLSTTSDFSAVNWSAFGWRETLAGLAGGTGGAPVAAGLRLAGSVIARGLAPVERRGRRGATYTLLLRRPVA
jgi:glycosyltransferase involved in cell wall biosynthesis/2-polyprenyl-3-methyl-5-hydroxy-6-metoxy-1,4-benzoquinol methylase